MAAVDEMCLIARPQRYQRVLALRLGIRSQSTPSRLTAGNTRVPTYMPRLQHVSEGRQLHCYSLLALLAVAINADKCSTGGTKVLTWHSSHSWCDSQQTTANSVVATTTSGHTRGISTSCANPSAALHRGSMSPQCIMPLFHAWLCSTTSYALLASCTPDDTLNPNPGLRSAFNVCNCGKSSSSSGGSS